jgi:hypothetical protein
LKEEPKSGAGRHGGKTLHETLDQRVGEAQAGEQDERGDHGEIDRLFRINESTARAV